MKKTCIDSGVLIAAIRKNMDFNFFKKRRLWVMILAFWAIITSVALADITPEQRDKVSKDMISEISKRYGTPKDLSDEEKITEVFKALLPHTIRKEIKYKASIVENKDINAYTTPNGNIVFFSGLLKVLPKDNLAPLAFITAHEISHVEKRHAEKRMTTALVTSGAIYLLVRKSKDWVKLLGGVGYGLINSGYSRQTETEADNEALSLMHKAGYDANGALVVLKIFEDIEAKKSGIRIFPTHPRTSDRYKNTIAWMKANNVAINEPSSGVGVASSSPPQTLANEKNNAETASAIRPSLKSSVADSSLSKITSDNIEKIKIPNITLNDSKGKKYNLASIANGRQMLLYIFSKPIRQTGKDLHEIDVFSKDHNFQPAAIYANLESVEDAIDQLPRASINFPILIDNGDVYKHYKVEKKTELCLILIDSGGFEVRRWAGFSSFKEILKEVEMAIVP